MTHIQNNTILEYEHFQILISMFFLILLVIELSFFDIFTFLET